MMLEILQKLADHWIGYKIWLIDFVGLTNDAMHIHGSIMILFVSAILLRRRPDSLWCWLIVLVAELFNEFADLHGVAPGEATIDAAVHDLYNTMFWPSIIVVLGRFLFPPQRKLRELKQDVSGDLADESFKEPAAV